MTQYPLQTTGCEDFGSRSQKSSAQKTPALREKGYEETWEKKVTTVSATNRCTSPSDIATPWTS